MEFFFVQFSKVCPESLCNNSDSSKSSRTTVSVNRDAKNYILLTPGCNIIDYDPFNKSIAKFFNDKLAKLKCSSGDRALPVFKSANSSIWLDKEDERVKTKLKSIAKCYYAVIESRYRSLWVETV